MLSSNSSFLFMRLLTLFFLLIFYFTTPANAFGKKTVLEKKAITIDNIKRIYWIYDARQQKNIQPLAKKRALILALHGGGARANKFDALFDTGLSFQDLADKEDVLILYPQGYKKQWNDGRGVDSIPAQKQNINDVKFLSSLIDFMIETRDVNPSQVYATGISNGGFMSNRLACDLSGKIAAVGIVTAGMPVKLENNCKPEEKVSVLIMNGTKDPLCPFEGGAVGRKKGRGEIMSTQDSFLFWLKHMGYQQTTPLIRPRRLTDKDTQDGSQVLQQLYKSKTGHEVTLYTIEGGGHTWPGGKQYLPKFLIGSVNRDIDGTAEIWNFFKRNAKKHPQPSPQ